MGYIQIPKVIGEGQGEFPILNFSPEGINATEALILEVTIEEEN